MACECIWRRALSLPHTCCTWQCHARTSSDKLQLCGAERDALWRKLTRVEPKAIALRVWAGEVAPPGVYEDAARALLLHDEFWRRRGFANGGSVVMPVPRFEGSFARRRGRCGKILEPEQVAAVEAALAGYTVVLLGQAVPHRVMLKFKLPPRPAIRATGPCRMQ